MLVHSTETATMAAGRISAVCLLDPTAVIDDRDVDHDVCSWAGLSDSLATLLCPGFSHRLFVGQSFSWLRQ